MQVIRGIPELAKQPSVLTIGNFDGVHRGHQALLHQLGLRAQAFDAPPTVLTFEPHPREYFTPAQAPARLASLREKLMLLAANGVARVHVLRFDARLARLSAEHFVGDMLVRGLGVRHIIIGDDFRFGAGRRGDFAFLKQAARDYGFGIEAMDTVALGAQRISSSAVRHALTSGDLALAAHLLGRPYSIAGRVSAGQRLGRTLGFPTANILMKHRQPALSGVFAVCIEGLAAGLVAGVANVGVRPTVGHHTRPILETHVFDWHGDCYGAHLRIHFMHKLRDEQRFESITALARQIAQDMQHARDWFATHPIED